MGLNSTEKDNIKKSILDYIKDDRRQQAILLDGPWGCGKSYFVKNILIPAMEKMEEYQVHCISLYGMNGQDIEIARGENMTKSLQTLEQIPKCDAVILAEQRIVSTIMEVLRVNSYVY